MSLMLSFIFCVLSFTARSQTFDTSTDNEFRFGSITCTQRDCIVTCDTSQGCFGTTIDASLSTNLTLTCSGDSSCRLATVYCPSDRTSHCGIDCGTKYTQYACANMRVLTPHHQDNLNLDLDCGASLYAVGSCEDTNIICGTKSSVSHLTPISPLQFMPDTYGIGGDWICSRGGCCPFPAGLLDCTDQTDECAIDCSTMDCSDYVIDGSGASHLTVDCDSESGGCVAATVQCGAVCTINCHDERACFGIYIDATNADSLGLLCDGSQGCMNAAVHCPYTTQNGCNIDCDTDNDQSCGNMNVYADNDYTENYLSIHCGSDATYSACKDTTFICATDDKESVALLRDDTDSQWKCEYETSSYCCPWAQPNNNANDGSDGSGGGISDIAAGAPLILIAVAVVGVMAVCCIIIIAICVCQKRKMAPYALRSAPAPVHQMVPTQPQPAMAMPQQVAMRAVPQQNAIPIVYVQQLPLNPAPPSYQQIQQQASAPEMQQEGPRAVTNC